MSEPADEDDDLLFAGDDDEPPGGSDTDGTGSGTPAGSPWHILIVDDEPEVHSITRMVLSDFHFAGRPVTFHSAHSAAEARELLRSQPGFAAILLDVVMEETDAGLNLVRYIRRELGDNLIRVILRTGQPGYAPEREVIRQYDINDYKAKSELTAQNLFTTLTTALRSYSDMLTIENSRRGLEQVIYATGSLFQLRSMTQFLSGILVQITALVDRDIDAALLLRTSSGDPEAVPEHGDPVGDPAQLHVAAGQGRFEKTVGQPVSMAMDAQAWDFIQKATESPGETIHDGYRAAVFFRSRLRRASIIYLETRQPLSTLDQNLISVFCANAAIGLDNLYLHEQLARAHKSAVYALAQLAEYKDTDTGQHVNRVERMSKALAEELRGADGYPEIVEDDFVAQIGLASVLHDVGKVGTPDHILKKPGPLSEEEFAVMREHPIIGGRILRDAARLVEGRTYLSLGAEIAEYHHERWDGAGYPHGIAGADIPLSARIVAVADVFDALTTERPYKEPYSVDYAYELIVAESGHHFDPTVVAAFQRVVEAGYLKHIFGDGGRDRRALSPDDDDADDDGVAPPNT